MRRTPVGSYHGAKYEVHSTCRNMWRRARRRLQQAAYKWGNGDGQGIGGAVCREEGSKTRLGTQLRRPPGTITRLGQAGRRKGVGHAVSDAVTLTGRFKIHLGESRVPPGKGRVKIGPFERRCGCRCRPPPAAGRRGENPEKVCIPSSIPSTSTARCCARSATRGSSGVAPGSVCRAPRRHRLGNSGGSRLPQKSEEV